MLVETPKDTYQNKAVTNSGKETNGVPKPVYYVYHARNTGWSKPRER